MCLTVIFYYLTATRKCIAVQIPREAAGGGVHEEDRAVQPAEGLSGGLETR